MISQDPAVRHVFVVSGFDLIGGGNKPNAGTIFIPLKDWKERDTKAQDLAGKFMGMGMMQPDGMALVFNPPPIMGLGSAGGFEVYVQNRLDGDAKKLNEVVQNFMAELQDAGIHPGIHLLPANRAAAFRRGRRTESTRSGPVADRCLFDAAKHDGRALCQ